MLMARHELFALALLLAIVGDSWGQSQQPSPSPRVDSQPPQSQATQTSKPPDNNQRGTESAPFVIKILPSVQTEQETAAKHQEELNKAAADQKIADFTELLFYATTALAGIAVLQFFVFGWQGIQLGRTVRHLAISERAHVSGGANNITTTDGRNLLVVTINNYGKTPASIGTVAATICEEGELDLFPGWKVKDWPGHAFFGGWKGYVLGQIGRQKIDVGFPFEAGKVIAGRIWYRDIFKKQYSVGFLLKTDTLTAVGRRPFWEEREESDPNE
jgi:hypothetical protein